MQVVLGQGGGRGWRPGEPSSESELAAGSGGGEPTAGCTQRPGVASRDSLGSQGRQELRPVCPPSRSLWGAGLRPTAPPRGGWIDFQG